MTAVLVEPEIITAAVANIESIGSTVTAASAAAASPTSNLLAAAADEVSVAFANLFGAYGQEFQAVVNQAEAFHTQFQGTLAAAANAYVQTEFAATSFLQGALGASAGPVALAAAVPPPPFAALDTVVFIGPTGVPIPPPAYVTFANELYVRANPMVSALQTMFTPEELYPITGVRSSTLNQSVSEGLTILDNFIQAQFAAGNSTTIFGYSQSAIISSLEMYKLAAMGSPNTDLLNFVLVGNEMNPNGGLLARFPNLTLPSLGLTFYGATPADTLYNVAIYTQEYDGFADFPRYPLNFISDLNAVIGIATVHTKYLDLTPAQIDNAIQLETSPGYYENGGKTYYYMIQTEELPILTPLRAIPFIGKPLAALVEPNVEVIVNLGYGDPYHGYSTSYADVHTTFGLFPEVSPQTLVEAFSAGTQQGIHDFNLELQSLSANPPTPAALIPPQPVDFVSALTKLPTPEQVVNTAAEIISTDYAVLLPTADTALSFITTLPLYNAELFLSELAKGNLINALGYPLAADVGLATVAGIVEFLVIGKALSENINALQALLA